MEESIRDVLDCGDCQKGLKDASCLGNHMKEVHVQVWTRFPPREADLCPEAGLSVKFMLMFKVFSNFRCDYCGKGVKVSENLEKHKQISQELPRRCLTWGVGDGVQACCHCEDVVKVLDKVEVNLECFYKLVFKLKRFLSSICDSCGKGVETIDPPATL